MSIDRRRGAAWRAAGVVVPHPLVVVLLTTILVLLSGIPTAGPVPAAPRAAATGVRQPSVEPTASTSFLYAPGWTNATGVGFWQPTDLPSPRQGAAMAYDPGVGVIVVYGGTSSGGAILNDTWIMVAGEYEWYTLAKLRNYSGTIPSPPGLSGSTLTYDAHDGYLLLYGGRLSNGAAYNGTWAFGGNTWMNLTWRYLTPTISGSPGAVGTPTMTYDSLDGAVLLFAGSAQSSTWEYRTGTWKAMPVTLAPSARAGASMIYDPLDTSVVLFGGVSVGQTPVALNDTWLYAQGNWRILSRSTVNPPALPYVDMAYDSTLGMVFLVGGGASPRTWTLSGGIWSDVTSSGASNLPGRTGFSIAYDPVDGWLMLLGGVSSGPTPATLGDVWGWNVPRSPPNTQLLASAIPNEVWVGAILLAGVPVAIAVLWAWWPRRRRPSEAPAPAAVAAARSRGARN